MMVCFILVALRCEFRALFRLRGMFRCRPIGLVNKLYVILKMSLAVGSSRVALLGAPFYTIAVLELHV